MVKTPTSVTIGHGKRLFGDDITPASFKLLESKTSTTGVIIATYGRDGEIKTGSFDLGKSNKRTLVVKSVKEKTYGKNCLADRKNGEFGSRYFALMRHYSEKYD